jgi:hypothetical protein
MANIFSTEAIHSSSPIPVNMMIGSIHSSETSVFRKITRRNILEDGILLSHCRENLKSYIALTGWALQQRNNVYSEVRTGFYIPEDDILHSHRRENLNYYIALTGWAL